MNKIPDCPYNLKDIATKVLMKWRARCYRLAGRYDPFNAGEGPFVYLEHLKQELEKRPHIPNKKESRVIRQQKAKQRK